MCTLTRTHAPTHAHACPRTFPRPGSQHQAKLAGSSVACPLSGCDTVLSSGYAQLFGVPLSLLGMLTYGSVVAAALVAQQQQQDRSLLNTGLAAGVSVLAGVSGFLM